MDGWELNMEHLAYAVLAGDRRDGVRLPERWRIALITTSKDIVALVAPRLMIEWRKSLIATVSFCPVRGVEFVPALCNDTLIFGNPGRVRKALAEKHNYNVVMGYVTNAIGDNLELVCDCFADGDDVALLCEEEFYDRPL